MLFCVGVGCSSCSDLCLKGLFFRVGFFEGLPGHGQSLNLVMESTYMRLCSDCCGLCLCPPLGTTECRPAAVYPLSPACVRHPSRAGTDPDTCHQCPTGMYTGEGQESAGQLLAKRLLRTQFSLPCPSARTNQSRQTFMWYPGADGIDWTIGFTLCFLTSCY